MDSSKINFYKDDCRKSRDRRSFELPSKIPVIDTHGRIIQRDRRHIPERRIANIEIKEFEGDIADIIFDKFFEVNAS